MRHKAIALSNEVSCPTRILLVSTEVAMAGDSGRHRRRLVQNIGGARGPDNRRWLMMGSASRRRIASAFGANLLTIRGLGERRKLTQRGLGRSPSRQRILEHFRSNLACFHNIFKWLFIHRNLWKNWEIIVSLNTGYLISVAKLNCAIMHKLWNSLQNKLSNIYTRDVHFIDY